MYATSKRQQPAQDLYQTQQNSMASKRPNLGAQNFPMTAPTAMSALNPATM